PCTGSCPAGPAEHVPDAVYGDVPEADHAKQLRHPDGALRFGAGRSGDSGQGRLAREGDLVGPLDVVTGGANAVVGEELRHYIVHSLEAGQFTVQSQAARRKRLTAASHQGVPDSCRLATACGLRLSAYGCCEALAAWRLATDLATAALVA